MSGRYVISKATSDLLSPLRRKRSKAASAGRWRTGHTFERPGFVGAREHHGGVTAPTVEAAIHELMDLAWNVVYDLLEQRGLLGDGLFVEEYTGIHSWVESVTRYTVVHSRDVAVLFMDTRPVDAIALHHDLLGADDPKTYFRMAGRF
jgi:hypothetical protein